MNEQHDRSIITAIRKMTRTFNNQEIKITTAKVLSVDSAKRTCLVELPDFVEITCRLMAQVGDGILPIPSIDSTVAVIYATYTDAYVIMCSDIDSLSFKGTELGGLVKVIQLTDKLNTIEDKINSIISTFNSHTHTSGGSGSPTTAPLISVSGTLVKTQQADIENTAIKHGS